MCFRQPTDLKQRGLRSAARVFEREFAIGVELTVAADAAPGDHRPCPARLRYQACDEKMCYIAATRRDAAGRSRRRGNSRAATAASRDVFDRIAFGHGEAAAAAIAARCRRRTRRAAAIDRARRRHRRIRRGRRSARSVRVAGTAGGYLGAADFLTFIHNAETGVKREGSSKAADRWPSC